MWIIPDDDSILPLVVEEAEGIPWGRSCRVTSPNCWTRRAAQKTIIVVVVASFGAVGTVLPPPYTAGDLNS